MFIQHSIFHPWQSLHTGLLKNTTTNNTTKSTSKNHLLEWPTSVTSGCEYCAHPFSTQPVPVPYKYDEIKKIFYVDGMFCGFSCAKRYIQEHDSFNKPLLMSLLKQCAKEVFHNEEPIYPADPKKRLILFGGELSIEEFRKNSQRVTTFVHNPPFVSYGMIMEEQKRTEKNVRSTSDSQQTRHEDLFQEFIINRGMAQLTVSPASTSTSSSSSSSTSRSTKTKEKKQKEASTSVKKDNSKKHRLTPARSYLSNSEGREAREGKDAKDGKEMQAGTLQAFFKQRKKVKVSSE
jgi:hypothetical protein